MSNLLAPKEIKSTFTVIRVALVFMAVVSLFSTVYGAGSVVAPEPQQKQSVQLGAPFCDNAILQRDMKVPVWGWGEPGSRVSVEFAGQKMTGTVNKNGDWKIWLSPMKASFKPRNMNVTLTTRYATRKSTILKDILVGEVWLASGQSNMQWATAGRGCVVGKVLIPRILARVEAGEEKYPLIREFTVNSTVAMLHPLKKAEGSWKKGSNYMGYSAIAFSFAYKLFQELNVPIGILNCSFSQTSIQSWVPREGFRDGKDDYTKAIYKKILETDPKSPEFKIAWENFYQTIDEQLKANKRSKSPMLVNVPTPGNTSQNRDATWLFNGKFSPVVPYAIKGAIWNQGYANSNEGLVYYNNLHSLIRGWRLVFERPELPVYFHQWYTPGGGSDKPSIGGAAEMRLGTWMARDIPHTGMASQIDIGGTIHYWHKAVPGQRLALHALKKQYGQKKLVVDGPMFKKYSVKGNQLIVEFEHAEGGLVVGKTNDNAYGRSGATGLAHPSPIENGEDQVKLVYLSDENRVWHLATIEISDNKLIASAPGVEKPRGISYATGGVARRASLYNKAMLPATPFIYYDHKMVLSKNWPDEKLKVAGETIDPKTFGKLYEWRKMPILSTQFRDNAVLQADKPLVFWGSTRLYGEWVDKPNEGKMVIHFDFNGNKKSIDVTPEMAEWKVVLPAMKASSKPHSLTVSAVLDGELVHKRELTGMVMGDVFYIASAGGALKVPKVKSSEQIVRSIFRKSRRVASSNPSRFSVCVSRTPKNRYASRWEDASRGLAANLGHAIAAKTGAPVGIIFMDGRSEDLKQWVPYSAISTIPNWREDYAVLGANQPDSHYYEKNIRRYMADWKQFWEKDMETIITTGAKPEGWGGFGEMPTMKASGSTTACQVYNLMTHSFFPTSLRGVIFLSSSNAAKETKFKDEMSVLANSWKRGFAVNKTDDVPFFYTMPTETKVNKPTKIKGMAEILENGDWSAIERFMQKK